MGYSIYPAPSAASRSERTVFITSTQSWTAPADVTSVDILLVGGGGGGGACSNTNGAAGGGGGGAGVLQGSFPVTPSASYTVTIGGGGAGGVTGNGGSPGSNGSNSSFGSLAISYGGGGAMASNGTPAPLPSTRLGSSGGQGTPNSYIGGKGGGAGMLPIMNWGSTDVHIYSNRGGFVAQGTMGFRSDRGTDMSVNPGLNGYGAGGGGAAHESNANDSIFGGVNAGNGGRMNIVDPENGVANFGGGGGGATRNTGGGVGGSGVCIIKYWSAL